jgi:hypoxanthine phosphoribosyltransferase
VVGPGWAPLEVVADQVRLQDTCRRLGGEIASDHPGGVVAVGVLKGSVPFLADLVRQIRAPVEVDTVAVSPYDPGQGRTRVVKDLDLDVTGRHVVLVTGIVDTGLTSSFLLRHLREREPASVALCGLVDKQHRRIVPVEITYAGLPGPDRFLLGYGLDFAGRYRNVPGLWAADSRALAEDPDRYVAELYPNAHRTDGPRVDGRDTGGRVIR